jgi:hypothetical protein
MSGEIQDNRTPAEEAWKSPSWKVAAQQYNADQRIAQKGPRPSVLISVEYLLAELRCAVLRVRLIQADLIAIGIALKEGRIAPDEALEELEAIDLVRIIRPTIPGVSP